MTSAATEPMESKPGLADLVEIFYAPSAVFARRRNGQWAIPYLALVVLSVAIYFATRNLMQPLIDADVSRALAQAAAKNHLTPDQVATQTSAVHSFAAVGLVAYIVIVPFVIALVTWVVGLIAQVPDIGKTALAIAVLSFFPRLIGGIVGGIQAAVLPDSSLTSSVSVSLSLARFVDPAKSPGLLAILGRFDLFILWGVVLIAIGVRVAARGTAKQAWATAIGVWVVGSLPALVAVLRS